MQESYKTQFILIPVTFCCSLFLLKFSSCPKLCFFSNNIYVSWDRVSVFSNLFLARRFTFSLTLTHFLSIHSRIAVLCSTRALKECCRSNIYLDCKLLLFAVPEELPDYHNIVQTWVLNKRKNNKFIARRLHLHSMIVHSFAN